MIGGAAGKGGGMDSAIGQRESAAPHDPIQRRNRATSMKTAPARCNFEMAAEIGEAAAIGAPFVQVAHQNSANRRIMGMAMIDLVEHGNSLTAAPQA